MAPSPAMRVASAPSTVLTISETSIRNATPKTIAREKNRFLIVSIRPGTGWMETIRKRFFSLAMVFGVAFLMLVSLIVSTVLGALATRIAGEGAMVGLVVDVILSLIVYSG